MAGIRSRLCFLALSLLSTVHAFYLPGAAPHDYHEGEPVELFVNALTPMIAGHDDAKLKSLINYDYYNPAFHFCQPEGGPKKQPESLGSILFGDRIFNSPYDIQMLQDNGTCRLLCIENVPPHDAKFINDRIREDYAINWLVDGLPAAEMKVDQRTKEVFFDMGFNLGDDEGEFAETPALHNHYEIVLRYHRPRPDVYRIVGVLVWPTSRGGPQVAQPEGEVDCISPVPPLILSETQNNTVRYTYRVMWNESDTAWATRWDNYLHIFDPRIHWFSLINAVIVVVFLCVMVSMILVRTVSRDISRYNAIDLSEDVQEDWGWKLVHGEVFRTPQNPMVLSVLVGNGAQLCAMVAVTLVFALLGFLSPSNRGSLATVMMVCWTFFGGIGGYVSARLYASMGGTNKRRNSFFTATIMPTVVFAIVFLLDLFLIAAGSSGAVPFGVLPFGAAFVELYFVLSSLFASRAYYAFGFLALTAAIVALTTATVTILFTYFILCREDYRWHWRAFLTGGGSAFWLLAYGIVYWASRLSLDSFSSTILYFGYLILLALFDFLITGTIGFLATYWAVRRLYSAIRVD
ncbi:hypothetical protein BN946_scf184979.g20 [Trametes cinnabarina]|uniref:Transmembrane 9 superfamily member n=1 Tax=Pycnoporus cinnabarinus TaxID=5643 RepID=A0A060SJ89_PYCCI|nr:hypothetical protein BN946_scf184979.g20 [Trametes cinnabarina]